jgi:hypothetical protein
MLEEFWVILGSAVVVRLGSAAEEVSAGSAADEVEEETFGRSVEETVPVVLASVFEVCSVVGEVVVFVSLSCVAEFVAPALSSSPVVCGVCDVVVALASFFWAATRRPVNNTANNASSHVSPWGLRRPIGKMRCRMIILVLQARVAHTPTLKGLSVAMAGRGLVCGCLVFYSFE